MRDRVLDLFEENFGAMSTEDFDYGHATAVQCHIQLKAGEEEPVRLKAWPLNPEARRGEASMKIQLKEWSSAGVIEPTQSPWAFPMVGVKKKDSNQLRWCVDYRGLNKKMVYNANPIASIENNLHKLQGAKYFTTLDSATQHRDPPRVPGVYGVDHPVRTIPVRADAVWVEQCRGLLLSPDGDRLAHLAAPVRVGLPG